MTTDVEKGAPILAPDNEPEYPVTVSESGAAPTSTVKRYLEASERSLVRFNLEERGIERVPPERRHSTKNLGYFQISLLWIGINR